eukprot:TRINITY_DN1055_c0_g1_i1.p2 TRINITY_DN1055_c0_g1~~TRINITY_DN1055_c0_g1_i1.p2  ORF type:complete len:138 (+),score=11.14 TRINITY_DN1055_c0_g1_i1:400-813(+)
MARATTTRARVDAPSPLKKDGVVYDWKLDHGSRPRGWEKRWVRKGSTRCYVWVPTQARRIVAAEVEPRARLQIFNTTPITRRSTRNLDPAIYQSQIDDWVGDSAPEHGVRRSRKRKAAESGLLDLNPSLGQISQPMD